MGCAPSKSNKVHPIPNLNPVKPHNNGSIPENSSVSVNGSPSDKQLSTENVKVSDESPPNQCNQNKQDQDKESENVTDFGNYDCHPISRAVNDTLCHSNHSYHILGNEPLQSVPKLPHSKVTSLRGPGTDSQIEFFKMLDRKIEAGPDYEDN